LPVVVAPVQGRGQPGDAHHARGERVAAGALVAPAPAAGAACLLAPPAAANGHYTITAHPAPAPPPAGAV
jgi:hypothetical protein